MAVDRELVVATERYLDQQVVYDPDTHTVSVPRLFSWYRGDFGGVDGIRSVLDRFDLLPSDVTPAVEYQAYDWSPLLGQFRSREDEDGKEPRPQ